MRALFYAHSGLRYLVLLAGFVAVAWFAYSLITKRPVDRSMRIVGSSFVGLLDTQILLGIAVLLTRNYYPALIGHFAMMFLAAVVVHATLVINRRKTQPGWMLPLVGCLVGLLFIIGGILAIARPIFGSTQI